MVTIVIYPCPTYPKFRRRLHMLHSFFTEAMQVLISGRHSHNDMIKNEANQFCLSKKCPLLGIAWINWPTITSKYEDHQPTIRGASAKPVQYYILYCQYVAADVLAECVFVHGQLASCQILKDYLTGIA